MAAPMLLQPPFKYSNAQDKIYVKASQSGPAEYDESEDFPMFLIKRHVTVKYVSDNKLSQERSFEVVSMEDESFMMCHQVNSGSINSLAIIADMLYNDKFIPFDFNQAMYWRERHLNCTINDEAKSCCYLSNKRSLHEKIRDFLFWMKRQQHNADKNVLPVKLEIRKIVTLPDEELKACNFWFDERKRSDPNYHKDFQEALRIKLQQHRRSIDI